VQLWSAIIPVLSLLSFAVSDGTQADRVSDAKSIVEIAEHLPTEYRADLELEVLESAALNRDYKKRVLVGLFRQSLQAQHAYPQRDAIRSTFTRHKQIAMAEAVLKLTTLDIQTRIIRQMMPISPSESVKLLRSINLEVPSFTCASPLIYNVDDYYQLVEQQAQREIKDNPRDPTLQGDLLTSVLSQVKSPVQLAPAVDMIAHLDVSRNALDVFATSLSHTMEQMNVSDRELEALEQRGLLTRAVDSLVTKMVEAKLPTLGVLQSFRTLLTKSLSAPRCVDRSADRKAIAERFDTLLTKSGVQGTVPSLGPAEIRSTEIAGAANTDSLPEGSEFTPLSRAILKARNLSVTQEMKSQPDDLRATQDIIEEFVEKLEAIPDDAHNCEPCTFYLKSERYLFLVDSAPQGPAFDHALHSYIAFLSRSNMQTSNPIEWLFNVKHLLNLSRPATAEQMDKLVAFAKGGIMPTGLPSPAAEEIKRVIGDSGNELLKTYLVEQNTLKLRYFSPFIADGVPRIFRIDP
jgi:hypothetical protein